MVKPLLKLSLFLYLISVSKMLFAESCQTMPLHFSKAYPIHALNEVDTTSHANRYSTKICTCEILILQSSYHRQKNFALFAEITKRKSLASDLSFARHVIEKEKKRMQSFFYDKLEVLATVADATDCKSLYKKLKIKNKSLFLYDILDADARR